MEAIKAESKIPLKKRITTFFSACPLRVLFDDGNQGVVGRGSADLLIRFEIILGKQVHSPVIEIGNFCESAICQIQIGGEHQNNRIFNNSLGSFPLLRSFLQTNGIHAYQGLHSAPTVIGHGVVLSKNCLVNVGARIGDGAVIGSGAVVTRTEIPRWSIAAGVPAKRLRDRISPAQQEIADALQWWNWDIEFFCRHVHLLLDAETHHKELLANRVMADERYRLVVQMHGSGGADKDLSLSLIALEAEGRTIPMRDTPQRFQDYFSQMAAPEDQLLTWMPNPFRLLRDEG
jgi:acetyltransferase-like isoleucine patch superfamily enzyme